jgi:hypothetical protein
MNYLVLPIFSNAGFLFSGTIKKNAMSLETNAKLASQVQRIFDPIPAAAKSLLGSVWR